MTTQKAPTLSAASPNYAWVILVVVYLASVVAPFNQFKIPPIMPLMMETFHIDLTQAGLPMSIIAAIGLALALPAGMALQRLGSKTTILIALGFMAGGAALGAFSTSFAWLMGSRVVEGIGMGLIGVAAPATIAMWFPPEKQGTPMGIWATWVPVGSVVIYNLAPALAVSSGWQSAWWLGAGFAVLMMIFAGWLISQPPALGAALETSAALKNSAALKINASLEKRETPSLKEALANRNIWLLALEFACMNLAMMSLGTYYPTFLNEVRGYPLGQAAFIASVGTFVILFSAPASGWLSDRIGSRRLVFSLPFLVIAVLMLFPFHATGWQITALMIIQGLLIGAIPTATFAAAGEVMGKPQLAGLGLAIVLLGQNFGQLVGPIVFGELVQSLGWATAGYLMIPVCLLGFVSAWNVKVR